MARTTHERHGKNCSRCHQSKPWSAFRKESAAADGHDSQCRKCRREYDKQYYEANRDRKIHYSAEWYAANRERKRQTNAEHYQRNREKRLAQVAAWYAANRERKVAADARRAARISQNGGWHSRGEWLALCATFGWRCVSCGCKATDVQQLTRDHVVPVVLGGSNDIGNIQPLCRTCNLAKGQQVIDYRPLRSQLGREEAIASD